MSKNVYRYALRNQGKIKDALGPEVLERILNSLEEAFTTYSNIEKHVDKWEGEPYPILSIGDSVNDSNMIAFYVIEVKYNVYKLAFKEFIG